MSENLEKQKLLIDFWASSVHERRIKSNDGNFNPINVQHVKFSTSDTPECKSSMLPCLHSLKNGDTIVKEWFNMLCDFDDTNELEMNLEFYGNAIKYGFLPSCLQEQIENYKQTKYFHFQMKSLSISQMFIYFCMLRYPREQPLFAKVANYMVRLGYDYYYSLVFSHAFINFSIPHNFFFGGGNGSSSDFRSEFSIKNIKRPICLRLNTVRTFVEFSVNKNFDSRPIDQIYGKQFNVDQLISNKTRAYCKLFPEEMISLSDPKAFYTPQIEIKEHKIAV